MTAPTKAEREEIRRLAEAASPPPWEWVGSDLESQVSPWNAVIETDRSSCAPYGCCGGHSPTVSDADRAFIAASRTFVPRLLTALDEAEARAEHMSEQAQAFAARASAMDEENKRLRDALRAIAFLVPNVFQFPADWTEKVASCPECRRYQDHPIQQGICDKHRKPLYERETHDQQERVAIGWRAKAIAANALDAILNPKEGT